MSTCICLYTCECVWTPKYTCKGFSPSWGIRPQLGGKHFCPVSHLAINPRVHYYYYLLLLTNVYSWFHNLGWVQLGGVSTLTSGCLCDCIKPEHQLELELLLSLWNSQSGNLSLSTDLQQSRTQIQALQLLKTPKVQKKKLYPNLIKYHYYFQTGLDKTDP